jgi:aspartyl-tRNA(Asn)/glutamyl-tRNA(Gln) amidotransferase subunit A
MVNILRWRFTNVAKNGRIKAIQTALESGKTSCTELTRQYLDAIRKNESLNAYISITDETAIETAGIVDAKLARGEKLSALEGVPFSLKDNISTTGLETSCASEMLNGYKPSYDAFVWDIFKSANAPLLGKANMDEFAMGSTCETSRTGGAKNPYNTEYVPGGSSGGSASAVAANIAAYSIGSDTGGSVRQPASFCGLVGLKPTYGAVSRRGLIAYASSLDQIGVLAQSTADCAEVFRKIAVHDALDMTSTPFPAYEGGNAIKIGVAEEFFTGASADVYSALQNTIRVMEQITGNTVEIVKFPLLKYALPVYYIIACAEASSNLGRYDGIRYGRPAEAYEDIDDAISRVRSAGFGTEVQRRILLGAYVLSSGFFDAYYVKARELKQIMTYKLVNETLAGVDFLITPTAPATALKFGAKMSPVEMYLTDICTVTVNLTGLPAVSVPCGFDRNGMPIGAQIIGKRYSDFRLFELASKFEQATDSEFLTPLNGVNGMGVSL